MGFLGFESEDIYTVFVSVSPMFDNNRDNLEETKKFTAYRKLKSQVELLSYVENWKINGPNQLTKFYNSGRMSFTDHLPTVTMRGRAYDTDKIKDALRGEVGSNATLENIYLQIPDPTNYAKWILQEQYGYNIEDDLMSYNGWYYEFDSAYRDPNPVVGDDNLVITIRPINQYKRKTIY